MLVSKPPKGGTLATVGLASPEVQDNPLPPEFRVYAEHRQFTERCSRSGTCNLARSRRTFGAHHKLRVCPHVAWFDLAVDRDGISRAATDAVGGGRREAFGVRQLAAAFLCANNVSVPMPRHPQNPFRVFRVFRGYNQPNHRSLLPKSARFHDTFRLARKPHRLTRPRHPKTHSDESSG